MTISTILNKATKLHNLTKEEIYYLLCDSYDDNILFKEADRIRNFYLGNKVHLRGLIEFSNYCKNNCLYCGIRRSNKLISRYRIQPDMLISIAKNAAHVGYKTLVLQSGEDSFYSVEKLQYIIHELKKLNLAITLSIGEKSFEEYQAYKEAGADRYLLRIETTDKNLYHHLDPHMSWDNRKQCLINLQKLGYELGSGFMVGLPRQSLESIADDILFLKELNVDMAGIGPFIPHPQTPLKNVKNNPFRLSLKVIAILRLLLPDINIPATTAMEALHPKGRILALQCGANVIMPNVTNLEFCKSYQLYPGKPLPFDSLEIQYNKISKMLTTLGRTIATDFGFHQKF